MHDNMSDGEIVFEFSDKLQPLTTAQWSQLFANHPDSAQIVELAGRVGLDGFRFASIIGKCEGEPILLLPLFETRYCLSTSLEGQPRKFLAKLEKIAPAFLQPKVLGVGFVEGEWGCIGVHPRLSPSAARSALERAIDFLLQVAAQRCADIVAFKDFSLESFQHLPDKIRARFGSAVSLPFCQVGTDFPNLEAYLQSLPRKMRQDLRRKMRQSADVSVTYTTDPEAWLSQIYDLYCQQVSRSDLSFGVHKEEFFAQVCSTVPGAGYFLFLKGEKLLGFNLVVDREQILVDKYIGMDPVAGRASNIYFVAFLEKVRYCTERGIKLLHLGAAAEGIKVRLGGRALPTYVMFRHRRPLLNMALSKAAPFLSYKPEAVCQIPLATPAAGVFGEEHAACTPGAR